MKFILNKIEIKNNELYNYDFFNNSKPKIKSNIDKNILFTILIIDIENFKVHLLVINKNKIVLDYLHPNPKIKSGEHRYIVYIFKQSQIISTESNGILNLKLCDFITEDRLKFNLCKFIDNYNLIIIDELMFRSIHN